MRRTKLYEPREESVSAIEYGFVAGLVTVACIVALTSLGDSWLAVRATVGAATL